MSDHPPPYAPHPPGGPSAPGLPLAFNSQPAAFPGSPYQTFPQTYTCGGDQSCSPGPPGAYLAQPGYQGYQSGHHETSQPWSGPKMQGEPPRHTVFVIEQNHGGDAAEDSCLAACSTALCCCCLWDMLTHSC